MLSYLMALVVGTLLLQVPGGIVLYGLGMEPLACLACAAPVTVGVLGVSGIALGLLGLSGATPLLCLSLALTVAVLALGAATKARREGGRHLRPVDLALAALYVIVAFATIYQVFIRPADGVDSFVQFDDNVTHLGMIASMMDGGSFSALQTSSYPQSLPAAEVPFLNAGPYPNGWHIVVALAGLATGTSAVVAENAVNVAFAVVAFPLGVLGLLSTTFERVRLARLAGAFTCLASAAFPLRMLTVHGAFPNFAAFCLVPAVSTLFLLLLPAGAERPVRWRALPAFLAASAGLALAHPNAIFSCVLILLPYLVLRWIPRLLEGGGKAPRTGHVRAVQLAVFLGVALAWVLGTRLDALSSLVDFVWQFSKTPAQAIIDVLSVGYFRGLAQIALAALVAIGLASCARQRETRWLAVSYLLVASVFCLGLCLDYDTRRLVTGYFYNDPERTAALLAIAAVPLSAAGLASICRALAAALGGLTRPRKTSQAAIGTALVLVVAAGFSCVNYSEEPIALLPGQEESAFHFASNQVVGVYGFQDNQVYTQEERDFVARVRDIVGEDELVLNMPFDGSVFAYPSDGLNVYYKSCRPGGETAESELIRTSLNEIGDNDAVRQAVTSVGARYLLVLDGYGWDEDVYTALGDYWPDMWSGLEVTDETPGFEVVLAEGPLRLYRVAE